LYFAIGAALRQAERASAAFLRASICSGVICRGPPGGGPPGRIGGICGSGAPAKLSATLLISSMPLMPHSVR